MSTNVPNALFNGCFQALASFPLVFFIYLFNLDMFVCGYMA